MFACAAKFRPTISWPFPAAMISPDGPAVRPPAQSKQESPVQLAAQQAELALAERDLAEMHAQLQTAEQGRSQREGERSTEAAWRDIAAAGGARPGTDLNDELLKADLDRVQREAAAERQLEELKKKMRKE